MEDILQYCPELTHRKTETGVMIGLPGGIQMHVPDGYKPEPGTGFFNSENFNTDKYHALQEGDSELLVRVEPQSIDATYTALSTDLGSVRELAYDAGELTNNSELMLYSLYYKVIRFQTRLSGLLCGNMVSRNTSNWIFFLSNLDADVEIGGIKTHVSPDELVPVSIVAIGFMETRIYGDLSQTVTCYALDGPIITQMWKAQDPWKIGRFGFIHGATALAAPQ